MKPTLTPGMTVTRRYTVDRDRTIGFMGEAMRVYATPMMLRDIERTCRDFLEEHLDAGENSVGARVELDHLGATLLDSWVEVTATVAGIEGRRVSFDCAVRDPIDTVGKCTHVRFVVDLDRQKQRLEAKAAKLAALPKG
ncbi:MAG: thioesterase family protein [Rhodospirillales bacterium]